MGVADHWPEEVASGLKPDLACKGIYIIMAGYVFSRYAQSVTSTSKAPLAISAIGAKIAYRGGHFHYSGIVVTVWIGQGEYWPVKYIFQCSSAVTQLGECLSFR